MAYDSRNAASVRHPEYIDPASEQNSWQVQTPYSYPGGYHGAYQDAPMAPQMDPNQQNQGDAWEDFPDDWPEDLDVNTPKNLSNGYQSPHITKQPIIQSPSPFFNPQIPSVQQPFQPTAKDSDMANVRSGLSYAAALSGKNEQKPAKEQSTSSGFDDIDLNDDSANFFSGNGSLQQQTSANAINDAFGLSAPMLPAAPSVAFSTSPAVEEEPHPADALAEAFSMGGPPKGMKVGSGINPFSKRSSPAVAPNAGGKTSPFGQSTFIQQPSMNAVLDSFSPVPQQSSPLEQSSVAPEAPQPQEMHRPQQNDTIANAFPSQSEENHSIHNGEAVAETFPSHSQEMHRPKHADLVAEAFATSSQDIFRPQQNDLAADPCHGTSRGPDVVAEAFSAPAHETHRLQQGYSEPLSGQQQTDSSDESSAVAEAFSGQSQETFKSTHADLVAEAFSTSAQENFRPHQNSMVAEAFHGSSSDEPDVVAEASSAPGPISGHPLENENTEKGCAVADVFPSQSQEVFNPQQADLVAEAFSSSSQEVFRPHQNDLVAQQFHGSSHEPDLVAEAFAAPVQENYRLPASDPELFSGQTLQNHNVEDINRPQQNDLISESFHCSPLESRNPFSDEEGLSAPAANEFFNQQQNDAVAKPFSDQMNVETPTAAFHVEQQESFKPKQNDFIADEDTHVSQEDDNKVSEAFFGGSQGGFAPNLPSQDTHNLSEPDYNSAITVSSEDPFSSEDNNTGLSQMSPSANAFDIAAPQGINSEQLKCSTSHDTLPMVGLPQEIDHQTNSTSEPSRQTDAMHVTKPPQDSSSDFVQFNSTSDTFAGTVPQGTNVELHKTSSSADVFASQRSSHELDNFHPDADALSMVSPQQSNTEVAQASSWSPDILNSGAQLETSNVDPVQRSLSDNGLYLSNSHQLDSGVVDLSASQGSNVDQVQSSLSNVEMPVLSQERDYQQKETTQGSNDEMVQSSVRNFEVPALSQQSNFQQPNMFPVSNTSLDSVNPVTSSAVEPPIASNPSKPMGVNPFRRSAPNTSAAHELFKVSQYSPDEHNPAFAKTKVKHQRPLNVMATLGHSTHTMSSSGKVSPFGEVKHKEHKVDNAVVNDVVTSNSGKDGPVGQDKSEDQSQQLSKPAANPSPTETSSFGSETSTPPPPVIPSSGPMAMTFRQSREKKARTPVAMSSLWSNQNSATGAPPFMLAPALASQTGPDKVQKPEESVSETPKPVFQSVQEPAGSSIESPKPVEMAEPKKIDLHDPNLSKKERKAEKKRLKALAKEQKKALKKANAAGSNTESQEKEAVPNKAQEKGNPHEKGIPSQAAIGNPHNNPVEPHVYTPNPHGNPHPDNGHSNPHGSNSNYDNLPSDAQNHNPTGHNQGNPHGNPSHAGHPSNPHGDSDDYGNQHLNPRPGSQHSNPHSTSDTFESQQQMPPPDSYHGNPHGTLDNYGDHQYIPRSGNPHDLDNPRLRELREHHYYDKSPRHEHSGSRSPLRQYDYDEYSHRGNSGGYSPRNSRDESSRRSESPYGAYHDNPHNKNERYHGATRREMEKYGDQSAFDYPRRRRSLDYEPYESKRSHEDSSYLDRSYESVRSDRLSRDEYYHDYYRDRHRDGSSERLDGGFKPIHPNDYRDSYRSHTPSSGSGRSSPSGYGNYPPHDQGYYGHYPHYPGYPPDPYGYYQGHYGHMGYPYYPYPPYPYDPYYQHYGAYGHGGTYSGGEASYQDQQQAEDQPEEHALDKEQKEEVQEVKPLRTTPLHFLRPHMTCRFGPGGKLLIVLPNHPEDGMKPLVEIQKLKVVFTPEEKEQIEGFPGPLTCQGTMKRQVLEYIQEKTDQIQRLSCNLATKQAKWVLWKFFQSLVKHNGAVVTDDVAEMLMTSVHLFEPKPKKKKRHSSSGSSSSDTSTDSSTSTSSSDSSLSDSFSGDSQENTEERPVDHLLVFRGLILEGHSKEALDYAMKNGLWGHAVLASGLMDNKGNNSMLDTKTSSGVIQRFFATLNKDDPLITLYEHLGGKVPHSLKSHENWASNLAGIVANPTVFPDKDKDNIVTLGDTLAKQPDLLYASHLCYLLAGLKPGPKAKMVLVGCDHRNKSLNQAVTIESLQLTELLEYASSLENPEYFLSNLQLFRYIHAMKLMDAGLHKEALSYLHVVGDFIIKNHFAFNEVFKKSVYKTAEQLVVHMESTGTSIELFINNWLKKLHQVIEGTDSGIFEAPKDESDNEEEEDPLAQSSVSFFSGYDQSLQYNEKPSPESTSHSVASRQPSVQSNNTNISGATGHSPLSRKDSQMSVHSHPVLSRKESQLSTHSSIAPLQTLDINQPLPTQIYQPGEPLGHKDSFSSQDQADGMQIQEENYQTNDIYQPNDNHVQWQQQPLQDNTMNMGNAMFLPGVTQQNTWPIPEQGSEVAPDEGETTPVPTFDDFYHQSNPMMANTAPNWQDDTAKTPTPGMQEMLPPKQEPPPRPEPKPKQEEKNATNEKANSGGGWFTGLSGLIQKVIPKGPNQMHLPDDSKKTIYFDKEKNKWINTEESEEDRAPPPPPPTDAMMGGGMPSGIPSNGPSPPMSMPGRAMGNIPATTSMPTSANPVPGNQRNEPGTPPSPGRAFGTGMIPDPSLPGSLPPGPPSKFSRRAQGRLGSQKKYVDVLNPNKGASQASPAVPSALFPILPPTGGGSFQGTLFVPSAAPADDNNDSAQPPSSIQSGANDTQSTSQTNEDSAQSFSGAQDFKQPQQAQFFDPTSFSSQPVPSSSRRGRGRYPR